MQFITIAVKNRKPYCIWGYFQFLESFNQYVQSIMSFEICRFLKIYSNILLQIGITNTKSNLLYVICTKYCTLHTETDFGIFAGGQRENLYIYSRFIIVQRASTQIHNPFLQTSMGKTKKNGQSTNNNWFQAALINNLEFATHIVNWQRI